MVGNLIHFDDPKFWDIINERHSINGGAYKIIAVRKGQPVPINRFLGTDTQGVLYIGKATSYLVRVLTLKKSISPKYKGSNHICGKRYKSNPNIALQFPYDILYIELLFSAEPTKFEKILLADYVRIFGEVPPLNAI